MVTVASRWAPFGRSISNGGRDTAAASVHSLSKGCSRETARVGAPLVLLTPPPTLRSEAASPDAYRNSGVQMEVEVRGCWQTDVGPPPTQGCLGVSGKSQFSSLGGSFYAHNLLYREQRLQLSVTVTRFPAAAWPGVLPAHRHGGGRGLLSRPAAGVTRTGRRLRPLNCIRESWGRTLRSHSAVGPCWGLPPSF